LVLANAAKDEFLGIVAHELRTPVSTLYGSSQFLRSHYDVLSESDKAELLATLRKNRMSCENSSKTFCRSRVHPHPIR
jgi:signal transduction histidine kinase